MIKTLQVYYSPKLDAIVLILGNYRPVNKMTLWYGVSGTGVFFCTEKSLSDDKFELIGVLH